MPPAGADTTDDNQFVTELADMGMNPATLHRANIASEITLGHLICMDLGPAGGGAGAGTIAANMQRDLPNLSTQQIHYLLEAATGIYCPDLNVKMPWVCDAFPGSAAC
jgi:hypothetical protein